VVTRAVLEYPAKDIAKFKTGVRRVYRDEPQQVTGV
jgi:hypothetical protein